MEGGGVRGSRQPPGTHKALLTPSHTPRGRTSPSSPFPSPGGPESSGWDHCLGPSWAQPRMAPFIKGPKWLATQRTKLKSARDKWAEDLHVP